LKIGYGALAVILAAFFLVPGSSFDLDNVTFDSANLFGTSENNSGAFETAFADDPKTHNIEMTTAKLPNGQLAYQMVSHDIDGDDVTEQRYGAVPLPSIPGPAIVIDEGDEVFLTLTNGLGEDCVSVHTHGVHYAIEDDGTLIGVNKIEDSCATPDQSKTYHWNAAKGSAGTWPYHDHTFGGTLGSEDKGLFGVVIVNEPTTKALINGELKTISSNKISKEYVLYMVETTFWGLEIDNENGGLQTPLWINPILQAQLNDNVKFHVVGLGTAFHTFHMHAHKWVDQGTTDVIDVKNIGPLTRHVFTVKAGEGVGLGDWMYHCHVFAHMQAGMSSIFRVTAEGGPSIPGPSPLDGNVVSFEVVDEPGPWFKNRNPIDLNDDGQRDASESLALAKPGDTVVFDMTSTNTVHTITSLIWPVNDAGDAFPGATNMPVDQTNAFKGGATVTLEDPGLYVFTCKIHPYMFAGIIVDDPETDGLDLGENIRIVNGITTASASPLAVSLLKSFFIVTDPNYWQDYTDGTWNVSFPPVDVRATGGAVVNLSALDISVPLVEATPQYDGIGEVWVNTQFEKTSGKSKYGSSTAVDTSTWEVTKKISLPEINMNHPHNMWTNTDQDVIYQTQWFDSRLTVFDRETGDLIDDITVGDSPSHVMTRPGTDDIFIALNGDNSNNSVVQVNEVSAGSYGITDTLDIGAPHPHGHWMNADTMVTPNAFTGSSSIYDFDSQTATVIDNTELLGVGNIFGVPIATGMHPSGDKYYVANLLDQTITCVSIGSPACNVALADDTEDGTQDGLVSTKPIVLIGGVPNLLTTGDLAPVQTGAAGLLPIQTPVSPDGKYVVTATLLPSITIIDTEIDELVLSIACDAGCHGANFGANVNGGYNAYVSSKFSNALIVFDPESAVAGDVDSNGILDATEASGIVGRVIIASNPGSITDDTIVGFDGMGGQGVLAIPNPYDGWIEETTASGSLSTEVSDWVSELSATQQDPYP
jgi:hypothetical protein